MPLSIPPAYNYQSPLVAVPTIFGRQPKEGAKLISCEIDWGTMGGPNNCVNINLQNNATLEFSQIVALSVDNSLCAADIQFLFPDTTETTGIPSYLPKCIIPVFTNQTQFFVSAPNAQPEDITRFTILNLLPPPVAIPFTVEQQAVAFGELPGDGATTFPLVDASISGTLEGISVQRNSTPDDANSQFFTIEDGTGAVLFTGQFNSQNNTAINVTLLDFNPIHVRFNEGLSLHQTGDSINGSYSVNLLYRTP